MDRKDAIKTMVLSGTMMFPAMKLFAAGEKQPKNFTKLNGNINHSVCKWCFPHHSIEQLADFAKSIGMGSVELLNQEEWPIVLKKGLTCAMGYGSSLGLTTGFNDPSLHDQLQKEYAVSIPKAANDGLKQIICFPGNKNGKSYEEGMENCARGLEPVIKVAEKNNIILSMELMNSKRDHHDYMADSTEWGVKLVEKMGSPNFKLLYDIYHMQVQEGNVIATITKYKDQISHYHTAGVPGRHELNEEQELFYPAVMRAIVANGFDGYIGHEFLPTGGEPLASLEKAVLVCDV